MTRRLYSISKVWHTRKHGIVQEPPVNGGVGRNSLYILIEGHAHGRSDDTYFIV